MRTISKILITHDDGGDFDNDDDYGTGEKNYDKGMDNVDIDDDVDSAAAVSTDAADDDDDEVTMMMR
jgi:hypothetical protein